MHVPAALSAFCALLTQHATCMCTRDDRLFILLLTNQRGRKTAHMDKLIDYNIEKEKSYHMLTYKVLYQA